MYHFLKKVEWICGNGIVEIGKKKICDKLIVTMPLPKQGEKKIMVAEIWEGIKKNAMSTIFLQHFHNKSQTISYYQFKIEFNTEITFLIQQ